MTPTLTPPQEAGIDPSQALAEVDRAKRLWQLVSDNPDSAVPMQVDSGVTPGAAAAGGGAYEGYPGLHGVRGQTKGCSAPRGAIGTHRGLLQVTTWDPSFACAPVSVSQHTPWAVRACRAGARALKRCGSVCFVGWSALAGASLGERRPCHPPSRGHCP